MNDIEILADAISDVGVWTWWQSDSPEYIQIEFNGTQLWNPPTEAGHPPSGKIALGFEDVVSIAFLTFDAEAVEENWPQLFHEDQIDHFNLNSERFTFTDAALIGEIIKDAATVDTLYGIAPEQVDWSASVIKIGFRAWSVGLVISAKRMDLLNFEGDFELSEVKEKNEKWWEYWNEYWRAKDTSNALPEDYACEVTIPAE